MLFGANCMLVVVCCALCVVDCCLMHSCAFVVCCWLCVVIAGYVVLIVYCVLVFVRCVIPLAVAVCCALFAVLLFGDRCHALFVVDCC